MGLVGPLTRILTLLNAAGNLPDVTFHEVNDGQENTGENTEQGTGEGSGGCEPNHPECLEDEYDWEQDATDSKKIRTSKRADKIARDLEYDDAHDAKDHLPGKPSQYDMFVNSESGNVYPIPKNGGEAQWLGGLW